MLETDTDKQGELRRRRVCKSCGERWTTIEYIDADLTSRRKGPKPTRYVTPVAQPV